MQLIPFSLDLLNFMLEITNELVKFSPLSYQSPILYQTSNLQGTNFILH